MLKNLSRLLYTSFVLLLLIGCEDEKPALLSRTQVIMGTFATISLEENNADKINLGFQHLATTESILSSYQKGADVYQLNQHKQVPSNPLLKDILDQSKLYHEQTLGYFDITIGAITKKLYRFGEDENIPSKEEINNAILGINKIQTTSSTITLDDNITIDLGGIGKGYAVDALSHYYHTQGIDKGQIALSGDIRCFDRCSIGIQDPFNEKKVLTTLHAKVPDLSISTSGTYRRFIQTKDHHHLIDPKTRKQGRDFVSVTIVSQRNNTLCDVMATALSAMPKDIALRFIESQNDFGYLLVTPKGEIIKGNLGKFVSY